MSGDLKCPKCGTSLAADAPHGLCPSCLLVAALDMNGNGPDRFLSPTTPGQNRFVPPAVDSLVTSFPQLELIELLGYGGMGAVYKARQIKLDRLVALKIVRSDAVADPAFGERFNREARTLARLSHPNVVAIHDFGEIPGAASNNNADQPLYYFLMEYVDGANLRQLMNSHQLPSAQALRIIPQVCDALQYAHDEGVVHRDIKPENILIDKKGRVKIADFGLAKIVAGAAEEFTLTGTHQVMGTPRYMAPEQMEGSRSVDHRADIYSLGVVFYEMLTGQIPAGHFEPPSQKANVDSRLDSIVLKAMARDPERRHQHASQIRRELETVRDLAAAAAVHEAETDSPTSSIVTAPERPAPQTVSEFLSYEAAAAAGWFAGQQPATSGVPVMVRWLAPFLCLAILVTLFQPWFNVYVTDRDATVQSDRSLVAPNTNLVALLLELKPFDHPIGMIAGFFVVVLLILQLASTGPEPSKRRWGILRILVTLYAFGMILGFRYEMVGSKLVYVFADPVTGAAPRHSRNFDGTVGEALVNQLEHQTLLTPWGIAGFASLLMVMVINAVSLRYAPAPTGRRIRKSRRLNTVLTASWILTAMGILQLIASAGLIVIPAFIVTPIQEGHGPVQVIAYPAMSWLIIALFLNTASGLTCLVAGTFVARKKWRSLAVFACVSALLPLSFSWPLVMPLSVWCLTILRRENIASEFYSAAGPDGRRIRPTRTMESSGNTQNDNVGFPGTALNAKDAPHGRSPSIFQMALVVAVVFVIGLVLLLALYWTLLIPTKTPLQTAVETRDQAMVQTLLQSGADPNEASFDDSLPLHCAIANGDTESVDQLILHQANVNARSMGMTPLMVASVVGNDSIVSQLLLCGADPNVRDDVRTNYIVFIGIKRIDVPGAEMTPLMLAAYSGYKDVVKVLLDAGADATAQDTIGQTAAEIALSRNYRDIHDLILGSTRLAVERIPDPPGESGNVRQQRMLQEAIQADSLSGVANWLASGGMINHADDAGVTPLMKAIDAGRDQIAAWMILHGAFEGKPDQRNWTPIRAAVEYGSLSTVKMLLDLERAYVDTDVQRRLVQIAPEKASVEQLVRLRLDVAATLPDSAGVTPLMRAAASGNKAIFEMLVASGGCEQLDNAGRSWLNHAIENRQTDFLISVLDELNQKFAASGEDPYLDPKGTLNLLTNQDAEMQIPLQQARAGNLNSVAERIEQYCNLIIQDCEHQAAESPEQAAVLQTIREKCDRALGVSSQ